MSFKLFIIGYYFMILCFCDKTIEGWIYADNWFELYFNGEKVATDPILFKPHNAVKISFKAPSNGVYNYAFWAQDYADDITGLEYDDTCLGDGGIRISLSDGTVSNSDWKCYIYMEGPTNPNECGLFDKDCTENGKACTVQYNTLPECWNKTTCDTSTTGWVSATEYTEDRVGWGSPPNPSDCGDTATYPNGCKPQDVNWSEYGESSFIWTSDLDYHNRIVCRYSYNSNSKNKKAIIIGLTTTGVIIIIIGIIVGILYFKKRNNNKMDDDLKFSLMQDNQMDGNPTKPDDHL